MASEWLVYLVISVLLMADVLIVAAMVILGAVVAAYFLINSFKDFIEGIINQLIRDILAELQGFIGAKPGKAAGYTSFALYIVKKVYALAYWVYSLVQKAITVAIILGGGVLAAAGIVTLLIVNLVLVYVVYAYLL